MEIHAPFFDCTVPVEIILVFIEFADDMSPAFPLGEFSTVFSTSDSLYFRYMNSDSLHFRYMSVSWALPIRHEGRFEISIQKQGIWR